MEPPSETSHQLNNQEPSLFIGCAVGTSHC
jgi:hypothetical protein